MACFDAFCVVFFVHLLARKMSNFPPEVMIWWTLKIYFWEIVKTLLKRGVALTGRKHDQIW